MLEGGFVEGAVVIDRRPTSEAGIAEQARKWNLEIRDELETRNGTLETGPISRISIFDHSDAELVSSLELRISNFRGPA